VFYKFLGKEEINMYFNGEDNEGWITYKFLDKVAEYDRKKCEGHYLIIYGFITGIEGEHEDKISLQSVINYMWRKNYRLVCVNHSGNVNCQQIVFEVR
jgi:hypothetical protein